MLSIPFLITAEVLLSIGIIMVVKISHDEIELIYSLYLLVINICFVGFYAKKLISTLDKQNKELTKLLDSEHASTKLIIERDNKLTAANEELRTLDSQKSEFITVIAHQMRTPLAAMKWTIDAIVKDSKSNITSEQIKLLQNAGESNTYLISLVEEMMLADKLESGNHEIILSQLNIKDVIQEVLNELRPKIETKKLTIQQGEYIDSVCTIKTDRDKLKSILQCLLENAVKYSLEKGVVIIQVFEKDGMLYVSIKDDGIGIPTDQQKFMFSKFYRGRNATRVDANGSGLGLFITKKLVEILQGTVSFESSEGHGTTFTFSLKK